MSQYFEWVNYTKRQRIEGDVFPEAMSYSGSCFVGAVSLDAASTLLTGLWKGDLVAFVGEYIFDLRDDVTPKSRPGLSRLLDVAIDPYDIGYEFEDVTGRFSFARGKDGYVPSTLEDGSDTMRSAPYTGPFDLDLVRYRFVVNETRGLYYDREATTEKPYRYNFDPLPLLLGTGRGSLLVGGEHLEALGGSRWRYAPDGLWVGDLVYPSGERPGEDYKDVSALYAMDL